MGQMVFVPCERARAQVLLEGESLTDVAGHAATPSLLEAHGYDESTLEDGEFAALCYAGVQAMLAGSEDTRRLVLACDLGPAELVVDPDDPYGRVTVRELRWPDVQALFADEVEAGPAIATARQTAAGHSLAEALELPGVESLLDEHDLLWFAPVELDALP